MESYRPRVNDIIYNYTKWAKYLNNRLDPSDKLSDNKLMSRFITEQYDIVVKNFLIAYLCG